MTGKSHLNEEGTEGETTGADGLRLDKWLWQARFFKTRSLAAAIASKGKVRINRMLVTKSHYKVRPGDVLTFAQGHEIRVVRILALGERRGPAVEAKTLYEEVNEASAPPTATDRGENAGPITPRPLRSSQKKEAWGGKDGVDPKRARRQAIDAKMNGR